MRTFKFTLLTMLSYVAVVVATPVEDRAPAEAIDRRQARLYVPLTTARGSSDQIENISPAHQIALPILGMGYVRSSALWIHEPICKEFCAKSPGHGYDLQDCYVYIDDDELSRCTGICDFFIRGTHPEEDG